MSDAGTATEPSAGAATTTPPMPASPGERPELAVAAAFAGGLLAALLLRRIAGGD